MSRMLFGGFELVNLLVLPEEADALVQLRLHLADKQDMATLRRLLDEEIDLRGVDRMADQDVVEEVARLMSQGRVAGAGYTADFRAVRGMRKGQTREAAGGDGDEAPAQAAAPPPEEKATTWVELVLVDERGEPVGGEEYWVRTASGKAITGKLDGKGRARVKGVDPGTCEITFPNLNATDWAKA